MMAKERCLAIGTYWFFLVIINQEVLFYIKQIKNYRRYYIIISNRTDLSQRSSSHSNCLERLAIFLIISGILKIMNGMIDQQPFPTSETVLLPNLCTILLLGSFILDMILLRLAGLILMGSFCTNQFTSSKQGGVVSDPKQWQAGLLVRAKGKRRIKVVLESTGAASKISQVRLASSSKKIPTTKYSATVVLSNWCTQWISKGYDLPSTVCSEGQWKWNCQDLKRQSLVQLENLTQELLVYTVLISSAVDAPKVSAGFSQQI